MKRFIPVLALLIAAMGILFFLLARGSMPNGPLVVVFQGRTNDNAAIAYSILGVTNCSRHRIAYKVDVEALGRGGWGPIRYNLQDVPQANTGCAGWLGGGSNALVVVAAPNDKVRFAVSYERVASRTENYISWALASLRISSPFNPRLQTSLVYPDPK